MPSRRRQLISELRRVYGVVWGLPLDPRNFHRKVTGTAGFVKEAGGRPPATAVARLYRAGTATTLHPPLLR